VKPHLKSRDGGKRKAQLNLNFHNNHSNPYQTVNEISQNVEKNVYEQSFFLNQDKKQRKLFSPFPNQSYMRKLMVDHSLWWTF
jgi:hypothetical protein